MTTKSKKKAQPELEEPAEIQEESLEEASSTAFFQYGLAVVLDRAIPDVRDGLKPVQRRLLYGALNEGYRHNKPHRKSAELVGAVLGKLHPHGDGAVYEAKARMAQDFVNFPVMFDGQGAFGTIQNATPAAARYTETRLSAYSEEVLLGEIRKTGAVLMKDNYSQTMKEPLFLPAVVPQVLVSGAAGIAVGYACDIPPHNLRELCEAAARLAEGHEYTPESWAAEVLPDFPCGCAVDPQEAAAALAAGKGAFKVRGAYETTDDSVIITRLPPQMEGRHYIDDVQKKVKEGGLTLGRDIREESSAREGADPGEVRIVVLCAQGAEPGALAAQLLRETKLERNYNLNLTVVNGGKILPNLSSLEVVRVWLNFRRDTLRAWMPVEAAEAMGRLHVLDGLARVAADPEPVIRAIKNSKDPRAALAELGYSEAQAEAILEMKLRKLARIGREEIAREQATLQDRIKYLRGVLYKKGALDAYIAAELRAVAAAHGRDRLSPLVPLTDSPTADDAVVDKACVVVLTAGGYLKRLPGEDRKVQVRGGRGASYGRMKEGDYPLRMEPCMARDRLWVFTDRGRVYECKAWQVRECGPDALGEPAGAVIRLQDGEKPVALVAIDRAKAEAKEGFLLFASKRGFMKRTPLSEFTSMRTTGLIASNLAEGDQLLTVLWVPGEKGCVYAASSAGLALMFSIKDVNKYGRTAGGVKGMDLGKGDELVSALWTPTVKDGAELLFLTQRGLGKRTAISEWPRQNRAGKGRKAVDLRKGDRLAGALLVPADGGDVVVAAATKKRLLLTKAADVRKLQRDTKGVKIISPEEGEKVLACAVLPAD